MWKLILFIIIGVFLYKYDFFRWAVFHPIVTIPWGIKDLFNYFKNKEFNRCPDIGNIKTFVSNGTQVFGNGKTLSLVQYAYYIYDRYNDKEILGRSGEMVTQKVRIVSNVTLNGIPYIKWSGVDQFTSLPTDKKFSEDDIWLFLLDEAGTVFNSREYKNNFNSEFLTTLLTSRHHNIILGITTQRFIFMDKILREICSTVTATKKNWRIVRMCIYDGYQMENCTNLEMLRPLKTEYWFATDKHYHRYSTHELVEQMKKAGASAFISTEEVLNKAGESPTDINFVTRLKRKYRKKGGR